MDKEELSYNLEKIIRSYQMEQGKNGTWCNVKNWSYSMAEEIANYLEEHKCLLCR